MQSEYELQSDVCHATACRFRLMLTNAAGFQKTSMARVLAGLAQSVNVIAEMHCAQGVIPLLDFQLLEPNEGVAADILVRLISPFGIQSALTAKDLVTVLKNRLAGEDMTECSTPALERALRMFFQPLLKGDADTLLLADEDGEVLVECNAASAGRCLCDASPVPQTGKADTIDLVVKAVPLDPAQDWTVSVGETLFSIRMRDGFFIDKMKAGSLKCQNGSKLVADAVMRLSDDGETGILVDVVLVRAIEDRSAQVASRQSLT